jgi:hypothetical protein
MPQLSSAAVARASHIRALAPAAAPAAPAPSVSPQVAATIAILQRELDALRAELGRSEPALAAAKQSPEVAEQQKLLDALRHAGPKGAWLTDLKEATGLSKNVSITRARALAYREQIWLSLEPNPAVGKLAYYVRAREAVEVA